MNHLIFSLNIVAPVFLTMLSGFALMRLKLLDQNTLDKISLMCTRFFIPCLLFNSIYQVDFGQAPGPRLMLFEVACLLCIFVLVRLSVHTVEKDRKNRFALVQGMFWANSTIFGLPITLSLCGPESTGFISIMIATAAMVFSTSSVLIRALYSRQSTHPAQLLKSIFLSPMLLGSLSGLAFAFAPFGLPAMLEKTILDLSRLAAPLSLMTLGASFRYDSIKENLRLLILGVGARIVVVPVIFLTISVLAGFRGMALSGLMAVFASPSAVTTFSSQTRSIPTGSSPD